MFRRPTLESEVHWHVMPLLPTVLTRAYPFADCLLLSTWTAIPIPSSKIPCQKTNNGKSRSVILSQSIPMDPPRTPAAVVCTRITHAVICRHAKLNPIPTDNPPIKPHSTNQILGPRMLFTPCSNARNQPRAQHRNNINGPNKFFQGLIPLTKRPAIRIIAASTSAGPTMSQGASS